MKFKSLSIALLLLLCPITFADSTGPNSPHTAQAITGQNVVPWGNANLVLVEDGAYASCFNNNPGPNSSNLLLVTNFQFNIPNDAQIVGVVVELKRASTGLVVLEDLSLAGVFATSKTDTGFGPASFAYETYGSPSDMWGSALTPAQANSSSFGFSLIITLPGRGLADPLPEGRLDHGRITVYYTVSRMMQKRSILVSQSRISREVKGR